MYTIRFRKKKTPKTNSLQNTVQNVLALLYTPKFLKLSFELNLNLYVQNLLAKLH